MSADKEAPSLTGGSPTKARPEFRLVSDWSNEEAINQLRNELLRAGVNPSKIAIERRVVEVDADV